MRTWEHEREGERGRGESRGRREKKEEGGERWRRGLFATGL